MRGGDVSLCEGLMGISLEELGHPVTELSPELNASIHVSKSIHQPGPFQAFSSFARVTMYLLLQPVSIYLKFTVYLVAPHTSDFLFLTLKPLHAHVFAYLISR